MFLDSIYGKYDLISSFLIEIKESRNIIFENFSIDSVQIITDLLEKYQESSMLESSRKFEILIFSKNMKNLSQNISLREPNEKLKVWNFVKINILKLIF